MDERKKSNIEKKRSPEVNNRMDKKVQYRKHEVKNRADGRTDGRTNGKKKRKKIHRFISKSPMAIYKK